MSGHRRSTTPYTRESLSHALAHHQSRGAVIGFEPPTAHTKSWRVRLPRMDVVATELSGAQCYALCLGLRAGEVCQQVAHERFVHELHAYNNMSEPPCLDDEPESVLPAGTRCGVHGTDTTSGRCVKCDEALCDQLVAQLNVAATLTEAEGPFDELAALCDAQPAVRARALAAMRDGEDETT